MLMSGGKLLLIAVKSMAQSPRHERSSASGRNGNVGFIRCQQIVQGSLGSLAEQRGAARLKKLPEDGDQPQAREVNMHLFCCQAQQHTQQRQGIGLVVLLTDNKNLDQVGRNACHHHLGRKNPLSRPEASACRSADRETDAAPTHLEDGIRIISHQIVNGSCNIAKNVWPQRS